MRKEPVSLSYVTASRSLKPKAVLMPRPHERQTFLAAHTMRPSTPKLHLPTACGTRSDFFRRQQTNYATKRPASATTRASSRTSCRRRLIPVRIQAD